MEALIGTLFTAGFYIFVLLVLFDERDDRPEDTTTTIFTPDQEED